MADNHMSTEEFFSALSNMFSDHVQRGQGSVYLTQKRLSYSKEQISTLSRSDSLWDLHLDYNLPVLIRATRENPTGAKKQKKEKTKLSTVVQPEDLGQFYTRYAEVCKLGMTGLKKKDRSKKKKDRAKKKKAKGESEKKS